jgi:tetratricopeptide (TPR) repeat protein
MSALSRGKRFRISIPDKPERSADVDIGAGKKAVAFLRECDMYWTNFKTATHAWGKGRASAKVGEYAQAIIYFDQAIQNCPPTKPITSSVGRRRAQVALTRL